jgi:hypothetical protein
MYELMYGISNKQQTQRISKSLIVRSDEDMLKLRISFHSNREDYGIISIVNKECTMVYSPYCGDVKEGRNSLIVDISSLGSGSYVFRMDLKWEMIEFKFIVFREDMLAA